MNETKRVTLAALSEGMPGITPSHKQVLAEAAAVCLENQQHKPGVIFPQVGLMPEDVCVGWQSINDQQRRCYADMQEATEWGACAMAILMIKEATGKVVIERSKKGTGFDYWIGDSDDDWSLPFEGAARLEVSGILQGTKSQRQHLAGAETATSWGERLPPCRRPSSRYTDHRATGRSRGVTASADGNKVPGCGSPRAELSPPA